MVSSSEAMSGVNVPDEEGWIEVKPRKRRNRPKQDTRIRGNANPRNRNHGAIIVEPIVEMVVVELIHKDLISMTFN